jgi:CRP-like cAMP-binding protein
MDLFGMQVASIGTGIVFGEQALLDDAPRNATIVCEDTVRLLCLSRSDFDRVVKQDLIKVKLKALSSQIRRLLREFDLFKELSPAVQDALADIIHYIRAPAQAVLFEQGDAPNLCYIILSGEVTVWSNKIDSTPIQSGRSEEAPQRDSSKSAPAPIQRQLRPLLESASALAREKCTALASILSGVHGQNSKAYDEDNYVDDTIVKNQCDAVAALGCGTLFGELALLNDNPRSATISCYKNAEFLVIEKDDFDRLLKSELNRAKEEKLEFLCTCVPGVRSLPQAPSERLLYYFNKEIVPKNHAFIEQGSTLMGDIFFVWQGSVESYSRLPNGGLRRRGIFLRGSVFAATPANTRSTFSVVATTSPCEVLHVRPEFRKHIPDVVMHSIKDMIDQTFARRMVQCSPLEPMSFETNPLDFLKPQKTQSRTRERHPRRTCVVPTMTNLFQPMHSDIENEVLEMSLGDAASTRSPKPQSRMGRPGMHESMSAPQLRPPTSSLSPQSSLGSSLRRPGSSMSPQLRPLSSASSLFRLDSPQSKSFVSKILHVEP